jgi:hypothetical protein
VKMILKIDTGGTLVELPLEERKEGERVRID